MDRRALLRWMVAGAVSWPLRGVWLHAQAVRLSRESVVLLRAAAAVVLPGELRAAGHDRVVGQFVEWLASYRSGAERNWGYGAPRQNQTAAISIADYEAQLRSLEQAAQYAGTLTGLPIDVRRQFVARALESAKSIPASPNGAHVLTDLMSFYYGSSGATDVVYRARIARITCRGLAGAGARPVQVAGD